jgi:hypothetical protein
LHVKAQSCSSGIIVISTRRQLLERIVRKVAEERFIYYGFLIFTLSLEMSEYAVEIERTGPAAEATGTITELTDILE